ncbi:MAG TPA: tetratricopeptide repeat protein, partial [Woeseiaceae bacterium]|nr:tetratricopeptide repeat protein [Woeseiaceae bacterium]
SVPPAETYVVQLGVFADPGLARAALARTDVAGFAYTTAFAIDNTEWQALQVGFYASEAEAEQALAALAPLFPDAWVRLVDDAERRAAEEGGALVAGAGALAVAPRRGAVADEPGQRALLDAASAAIIDRRYDDAVAACTAILEVPASPYRARAREYIGVALERSGQTDRAVAEYRAWLAEFGAADSRAGDAKRVGERLRALTESPAPGVTAGRAAAHAPEPRWAFFGGVSQYYWRNEEQFVDDGNHIVSSTGILNLADVTATRSGTRYDLQARVNGAYQFDLIEYDGDDHTGWITNAYIDVADRETGLRGRAGRQARRQDGVIGRFDGASVDYALTERISLGASAGLPIDSPRYRSGSHRTQFGVSTRFADVVPGADLNVYLQRQTVDGIVDREALGGEARYRLWDVAFFGMLDYDVGFGDVNLAMLNAQWVLPTGWTVNLRAETGVQPFITTRNALAGQGVGSIETLLETYSEEEVRALASDRTGSASRFSAAFSIPLAERFDLSIDASVRRFGGTAASGGVAAIPDSGTQSYLAATLVSTSLFSADDLNTLSVRYDASYTRDRLTLLLDSRIAIGSRLRVRPAISLSQLDYHSPEYGESREFVVEPSLRLYYRWKRILFDAEAGIRYAERENPARPWDPFSPDGHEQLSGMYLNLGYQMEF